MSLLTCCLLSLFMLPSFFIYPKELITVLVSYFGECIGFCFHFRWFWLFFMGKIFFFLNKCKWFVAFMSKWWLYEHNVYCQFDSSADHIGEYAQDSHLNSVRCLWYSEYIAPLVAQSIGSKMCNTNDCQWSFFLNLN